MRIVLEARTAPARALGCLLLRELPEDVALLLPRCRSVHTFGMAFALDLVWLGPAGEVVRLDRGVPPRRLRACRSARSVLEARAGAGAAFAAEAAAGGREAA